MSKKKEPVADGFLNIESKKTTGFLLSPTHKNRRRDQTLVAYENLKKHFPFPNPQTSLSDLLPREEDIARVRARNALKG